MGVTWDEDPRPGDIILAASKNPKWAIYATLQLLTGAPSIYTHAALCLDNGEYLDHRPGGALIRPLEDLHERNFIAFSRNPLTDEQRALIVGTARAAVGAPYTFWRFGYLAGRTVRAGKRVIDALDRKCNNASICSELICRVYQEAGISLAPWNMDPRDVSPGTLSRFGTWSHYQVAPLGFLDPEAKLA
jgi:uncharacterized protein YycO